MDRNCTRQNTVHTPYNFVPFSEKVFLPYEDIEGLPSHDTIDPQLHTGEIHITMTAETPVFISDGNRDDPHFFRGPNGSFQLPGSTIRGMVRQNIQVLGFGLMIPDEDMDDYSLFFREVAALSKGVNGPLQKQYQEVLAEDRVQSGFLRKEKGKYFLYPHPEDQSYRKIPRNHASLTGWEGLYQKNIPVWYRVSDKEVIDISRREDDGDTPPSKEMQPGVLLCTGKAVGKHENPLYLFPLQRQEEKGIQVPEEDIVSYKADWEMRKKVDFWALPKEEMEEKPVFFRLYNNHCYFGMCRFFRIGYQHTLAEGLPEHHKQLIEKLKNALQSSETDRPEIPVDYPRAMLGYSLGKYSYKSRVSFGDLQVQGSPREMELVETILSSPKPSYYAAYVVDGKNYAEDDFTLRGYKHYWLKKAYSQSLGENKKVAVKLRPLPSRTRFSGVIRYKNLREDELGLLLWALRLNDGCYQSVGMGKPYGYGRTSLTIDDLREWDPNSLYSWDGLCGTQHRKEEDTLQSTIQRYIAAYDTYACEKFYIKKPKEHPTIRSRDEIQDFLYLHRILCDGCHDRCGGCEASYMKLGEHRSKSNPLPDVKSLRQEREKEEGTCRNPSR